MCVSYPAAFPSGVTHVSQAARVPGFFGRGEPGGFEIRPWPPSCLRRAADRKLRRAAAGAGRYSQPLRLKAR